MKYLESLNVTLFSFLPLLMFLMFFTNNSDFDPTPELLISETIENSSTPFVKTSCPAPSTIDISTLSFSHKIKTTYEGTEQVLSWDTNNPQTTDLDYDGGNWAYYHNNGYGYLEVKITLLVGGSNCNYYKL